MVMNHNRFQPGVKVIPSVLQSGTGQRRAVDEMINGIIYFYRGALVLD